MKMWVARNKERFSEYLYPVDEIGLPKSFASINGRCENVRNH